MIQRNDIEVSKNSIKLLYRLFLTDTAPGIIFIITLLVIFKNADLLQNLGQMEQVLLGIFLFLLATPLGLAFNALSYFLYDTLVIYSLQSLFYKTKGWPLKDTKEDFYFELLDNLIKNTCKRLKIDVSTQNKYKIFNKYSNKLLHLLEVYHESVYSKVEHAHSGRIFFRSLSLLLFLWAVILLVNIALFGSGEHGYAYALMLFITGFLALLLSALTSFHLNLNIFYYSYLIAHKKCN
ncbi:hypothetical protein [Thiorhodospira sibirica]|uniref:hypothetical protein n=1 Tax=Thiorhodospira sibirica TaxID=154347 RepID=UPI00022C2E0F|nr:hypothetical protein [Thiorhodospira sibirica]